MIKAAILYTLSAIVFITAAVSGLAQSTWDTPNTAVLFSTFPANQAFTTNMGYTLEGTNSWSHSGYQATASAFTPAQTAPLENIELPLMCGSGPVTNLFTIDLCLDNSGTPGSLLESFTVSAPFVNTGAVVTVTSILQPLLSSSQEYWLEVFPGDPTTFGGWCDPYPIPPAGTGIVELNRGSGWYVPTTYRNPAFTIIGAVPEPSTPALVSLAAFSLMFKRLAVRRRKI